MPRRSQLPTLLLVALFALSACEDPAGPAAAADPLAAANVPPPPKPIGPVVAFQRRFPDGNSDIFRIATSGQWLKQLTSGPAADSQPAFSPTGKKLAWVRATAAESQIYVMNPDGSGQINLSNSPYRDRLPVWSPDGTRILFERLVKKMSISNWEIYVMNADGSGQVSVSKHTAADRQPGWSPNGSQVVFVSERDGNWEVYRVNADGRGLVNLTQHPLHDYVPTYSPDGQSIAFYRIDPVPGVRGVFTMQADGSSQTAVASMIGEPRWSPDGSRLLGVGLDGDLVAFDPDGSDLVTLATSSVGLGGAAWSPSGTRIAYWSYESPQGDGQAEGLRTIGPDGRVKQYITNHVYGSGILDRWPTWAP